MINSLHIMFYILFDHDNIFIDVKAIRISDQLWRNASSSADMFSTVLWYFIIILVLFNRTSTGDRDCVIVLSSASLIEVYQSHYKSESVSMCNSQPNGNAALQRKLMPITRVLDLLQKPSPNDNRTVILVRKSQSCLFDIDINIKFII